MKKVLFIMPSLGMGGMERVLVNYANLFCRNEYDVTVMNLTYDDPTIVSLFDKNITYLKSFIPVPHISRAKLKDLFKLNFRVLPFRYWVRFHSDRYLHKKYIKDRFDIEIAFGGVLTMKIVNGCTDNSVKRLAWIHSIHLEEEIPYFGNYKRTRYLYDKMQRIVCVSGAAKEAVANIFHRTQNVSVIYNPNDEEKIATLAKEHVEKNNRLTFVTVGRAVNKEKGFDRLLRAVYTLNQMNYAFDLWVVGDGADYQKLVKIKEELNLTNVSLCGYSDNPYKYINAADVFVCSSLTEGYSLVVAEAFLLNKPIISTRCDGPVELLDNGNFGLLVENSEEGITQGMKKMLDNPDLIDYYKTKSAERRSFFDAETIFKEIESIIL